MGVTRRPVLKSLLGLPLIGLGAEWFSRRDSRNEAPRGAEFDSMFLAVRTLRVVNTAAAQHYRANHRYPSLGEFRTSAAVEAWLEKSAFDPDVQLYSALRFTSTELVPGWLRDYKLTKDGRGYVMLLTPAAIAGRKPLPSFATDAAGVIHQGERNATLAFAEAQDGKVLVSGHAIRVSHDHPSSIRAALRSLAVGVIAPVAADSCDPCCSGTSCCCDFPCSCSGQCSGDDVGNCRNCGCTCCTWCCTPA